MSKNLLIWLIISIILSGCSGDTCIDADDFGFQKFTISARYQKEEIQEFQPGNQVAIWRDSGLRTNGDPLTIVVKTWDYLSGDKNKPQELSAWCPWYGYDNNTATLSSFCERLRDCSFVGGKMCTPTKDAQITNAPCIFRNGIGLYALIADPEKDPNVTASSEISPLGITFHLGVPTSGYTLYDINKHGDQLPAGGIRYLYSEGDSVKYHDSQLFFKILDKFYDDNSGQYRVIIKSGVSDDRPDPLDFLTRLVMKQLFGQNLGMQDKFNTDGSDYGLVKTIFNNIITKNSAYKISVSAILTLYIMFTAFSFLIGSLNITHTEIIIRVIKIAIVSALLTSEHAWSFFYDYLFVYFVGGVMEVKNLIMEAGATGPGSISILGLMIAPQTMSKLFSLLFTDWLGFIYIILFLIALYFVLMIMLKATIIYLTALIAIGMIITMGPIFICFLLFDITKSLFENWLKQLISYAFQPILLFAGIAMISILIRSEIYASLGFRVCKHDFPDLGPINEIFGSFTDDLDLSLGNSIFYWWFPEEITRTNDPADLVDIPIPDSVDTSLGTKCENSCLNTICKPYECIGKRFIQLPFLDPTKDRARIDNFANGNFVQLDGLLLIFVYIYLLSKFNDISISISRFISGTQNNFTNLDEIGQQSFAPIKQQIDRPFEAAYDGAKKTFRKGVGGAAKVLQEKAPGVYGALYAVSHPGETFAEIMKSRLRDEALDPKRANSAVLAEVKKNYGMNIKDVKAGAAESYTSALKAKLRQLNPKLEDDKLNEYAAQLAKKDYKTLKDDFADAVTSGENKKYDSLDAAKRKAIDDIMGKDSLKLRELSSDAKFNRDFQEAYVKAHQDMSKRGIGLFGKNISGLRTLEELKHKVDSKEELKKSKRRNIGESIYAGYEGLKRKAITAVTGEALRDSFEGSLTGAAWHDFDYNDPRLRTYNEYLKDQQKNIEYQELRSKINRETINAQEDVLRPEYLVKLESQGRNQERSYYEELSKQKLAYEVRDDLHSGEDPAIMGDRFMQEKATDSQLRGMIDKINNTRHNFIENDRYIRREEHYEIMQEKAIENIQKEYDDLIKKGYPATEVTVEKMPELLVEYYYNQPIDIDPYSPEKVHEKVEKLKKSINDFNYTEQVLQKISDRKEKIQEEFNQHIEEVNGYRNKAGMDSYKKPEPITEGRKLRSIQDHLRK